MQMCAPSAHGRLLPCSPTGGLRVSPPQVVWKANAPHLWRQSPKNMSGIDIRPHSTLAGFAAFGHSSLYQHVIAPNRAAGLAIDIFLHSWHGEIGQHLDAMYSPVSSKHEEVKRNLHPVRSQHLSMRTVLDIAAAHARHSGKPYDLTMMARYDVLFFRPLLFRGLNVAPLWLPHWCHRYPLTAQSGMLVRAACGNWPAHGEGYLVHPAVASGVHPPLKGKISREADFDYAYLDWWFIARPDIAHTWGEIYDEFDVYQKALQRIAPFPAWGHFFWGHHINKRLKLKNEVRYLLYEGRDFRLARHWHLGTHCMHFLGPGSGEKGGGGVGGSAISTADLTSDSSDAIAALSRLGVDRRVFFRRTQRRGGGRRANAAAAAAAGGQENVSAGLRSGMQLARQCPLDTRVRLYCPWLSPVCPSRLRAAVLDIEEAARTALISTSKLPPWPLFGDAQELDDVRTEAKLASRNTA